MVVSFKNSLPSSHQMASPTLPLRPTHSIIMDIRSDVIDMWLKPTSPYSLMPQPLSPIGLTPFKPPPTSLTACLPKPSPILLPMLSSLVHLLPITISATSVASATHGFDFTLPTNSPLIILHTSSSATSRPNMHIYVSTLPPTAYIPLGMFASSNKPTPLTAPHSPRPA